MIHLNSHSAQERAIEELKSYPLDGHWAFIVEPYEKARTNQQNRLYWKLCQMIASEQGQSKEETHEELLLEVFGIQERELNGETLRELKRSSTLNTSDFSRLIEKAYQTGHFMGLNLPIA